LSGGQRQTCCIARAVCKPTCFVTDEPTSSLTQKTAVENYGTARALFSEEKNIPALVNIHDVKTSKSFANA